MAVRQVRLSKICWQIVPDSSLAARKVQSQKTVSTRLTIGIRVTVSWERYQWWRSSHQPGTSEQTYYSFVSICSWNLFKVPSGWLNAIWLNAVLRPTWISLLFTIQISLPLSAIVSIILNLSLAYNVFFLSTGTPYILHIASDHVCRSPAQIAKSVNDSANSSIVLGSIISPVTFSTHHATISCSYEH